MVQVDGYAITDGVPDFPGKGACGVLKGAVGVGFRLSGGMKRAGHHRSVFRTVQEGAYIQRFSEGDINFDGFVEHTALNGYFRKGLCICVPAQMLGCAYKKVVPKADGIIGDIQRDNDSPSGLHRFRIFEAETLQCARHFFLAFTALRSAEPGTAIGGTNCQCGRLFMGKATCLKGETS
ncbi:MAG: hypothetical protein BWY09_02707 [Candidatus Hydrogenedentes bacterium ADurb.Bin179]|nr:MAG: hypothetical protein BWY09_02707 [Candidatus Hydrogenedentes bacterium ADurb.Bin179]